MKHDGETPVGTDGLPGPARPPGDLASPRGEGKDLCRELQSRYARLDALAREGAYGELADEAAETSALLDELRQSTSMAEPPGRTPDRSPGDGGEPGGHRPETERALTEILRRQGDVLQVLGAAARESRDALDYLARARRGVERYCSLRSIGPRLRSCWA